MNKFFYFILLFAAFGEYLPAQNNTISLTLEDAIMLAEQRSLESQIANNTFLKSQYVFNSFKYSQLPYLSLSTNLMDFNRSISKITLPDGSDSFVERKLNNSDVYVNLNQKIFTGGEFFINSGLQRIDVIGDSLQTSYLSTPINIGFRQPIFNYNPLKWDKKIKPLEFEISKKEFIEDSLSIIISTINYYFDYALAKLNYDIEKINYNNNDTLYKIGKGRYKSGIIAQDELLQLELNFLNSEYALQEKELEFIINRIKLLTFLGYNGNEQILITIPDIPHIDSIPVDLAVEKIQKNNPKYSNFKKELLQAQSDVEKAKFEKTFNANLYASYGLTQTNKTVEEVYKNPQDRQSLSIGIEIPIWDWGTSKMNYKIAQSNLELTQNMIERNKQDFYFDILTNISRYNFQKEQIKIAAKADTIASLKYDISKYRYITGKITITELNIASTEKDRAKTSYLQKLKSYWIQYYEIEKLALFDFRREIEL